MLPFCTLYMKFLLFTIRKYTDFIWNRNIFPLKTFPDGVIRFPLLSVSALAQRRVAPVCWYRWCIHLLSSISSVYTILVVAPMASCLNVQICGNHTMPLTCSFLRLYVLLDFSDIAIFGFSRSFTLHSSIWALYIIYLYLYTRAYTCKNGLLYKALIINII